MVIGADKARDDAKTGGPAGWKQADMIGLQEGRDFSFERQRQGRIADERGRAGAVNPELLYGLYGRIRNRRVRGQAEIILGREIDPLEQLSLVGARLTIAVRPQFGRTA